LSDDIMRMLEEEAKAVDKAIEKYIPRKFKEDSIIFKVIPPNFAYNLEALDKAVADPTWEFLDR